MAPKYEKRTHTVPAHYPRNPSTVISPDTELSLVVDEYAIATAPRNGLTLFFTHGTSFNKGSWEFVVNELLEKPGVSSRIKRILALDAANHGDSAVTNSEKLAKDKTFWPDHSKDILKVLEHFRAEAPVIGIGHSFGGGAMAHAAMMAPSAFWATIFVEPILFQFHGQNDWIADRALKRRDRWSSREEASAYILKDRTMSSWHPQQLQKYVETGIRKVESGRQTYWTLKTPKEQEAATYRAKPHPHILDMLAKSRQLHYYLLGERSIVLNADRRADIGAICKSPGWAKTLQGVAHLIPQTHPSLLAGEIATILIEVVGSDGSAKL